MRRIYDVQSETSCIFKEVLHAIIRHSHHLPFFLFPLAQNEYIRNAFFKPPPLKKKNQKDNPLIKFEIAENSFPMKLKFN